EADRNCSALCARRPARPTRTPALDERSGGVFVDIRHWRTTSGRDVATFRFYTDQRRVLTGRYEPIETLNVVCRDIENGRTVAGPAELMGLILRDALVVSRKLGHGTRFDRQTAVC